MPDQLPSPQFYINPQPTIFHSKRIYILLAIFLGLTALIFLTPLDTYLAFQAVFNHQPLQVGKTDIPWDQLQKELELVTADKNLKNRQERLNRAIDKAVERQILRQSLATTSAMTNFTLFEEYLTLKKQVEQSAVNLRTGGYFIATFVNPKATGSADTAKETAQTEISKLRAQLLKGEDFQTVLKEANQNPILKQLNFGAFLPGNYLQKVTKEQFPLKIKSFQERFFSQPVGSVSDVITLSWDDYEGPTYGQKVSGQFAYAVIKIDEILPNYVASYEEWLAAQKQKLNIKSNVVIPFFFRWF